MTAWCVIRAGWKHGSPQDDEEDRPEEVDGGVQRAPKLADGPNPLLLYESRLWENQGPEELALEDGDVIDAVKPVAQLHAKAREEDATGAFEPTLDTAFFSESFSSSCSPTPNLRNLFSTIGHENSWDVFLISCGPRLPRNRVRVRVRGLTCACVCRTSCSCNCLGKKSRRVLRKGQENRRHRQQRMSSIRFTNCGAGWTQICYSGSVLLILLHIYTLRIYSNTSSRYVHVDRPSTHITCVIHRSIEDCSTNHLRPSNACINFHFDGGES
jgi:hypothetical protein